jgi:hypothetical protein
MASRNADERTNQKYEVKADMKPPVKRTRASKSKKKEAESESEDEDQTPLVSSTKTKRVSEEGTATKTAGRRSKTK